MKKIFLLSILCGCMAVANAQYILPRFGSPPSGDNTGRVMTYSYSTPTYSSAMSLHPNSSYTIVAETLTGAQTVTTAVTASHPCDEITFMYYGAGAADGGSAASYTVTYSTGFEGSATTLVVDSTQIATSTWIFNYKVGKYIEKARARE